MLIFTNWIKIFIELIGYIIVGISIESNLQNIDFQPENAHKKRYQYIIKLLDEFISYEFDLDDLLNYLDLYNILVEYKENTEVINSRLRTYLQSLNIPHFMILFFPKM